MLNFSIIRNLDLPKVPTLIYLVFLFIVSIVSTIILKLTLIKSIKQALNKENINIKENYIFGFCNLFNAIRINWYRFKYVLGIPSIILLIGICLFLFSIILLYTQAYTGENFITLDTFISIFSSVPNIYDFFIIIISVWFLFLIGPGDLLLSPIFISSVLFISISIITGTIFIFTRGPKVAFSIISAVNNDDFSKEAFMYSCRITNFKRGIIISYVITLYFIYLFIRFLIFKIFHVDSDFIHTATSIIFSLFSLIFLYIFFLKIKEELIQNNLDINQAIKKHTF